MIWIPEFIYKRLPAFYAITGFIFLTMPPAVVLKIVGVLLLYWSLWLKTKRIKVTGRTTW